MGQEKHQSKSRGEKTICLPIKSEEEYRQIIDDPIRFKAYLNQIIPEYPRVFPPEIEQGFSLFGTTISKKQNLKIRRIQLKANFQVYQLRPSFMMPYWVGKVEDLEKPLYLRRYGVPFDALTYVFGKNDMYWYRAYVSLGRFSIVGTTVKDNLEMPVHLVADEKHTRWQGQRVYLPTVASKECILGIDIVEQADTISLTEGYKTFADEARNLEPNYSPLSVNTDGWEATQQAWRTLFPNISVILCFLHFILGIRDHIRRDKPFLKSMKSKLWRIYQGSNKKEFSQRFRRFYEWSLKQMLPNTVRSKIEKAKTNYLQYRQAYEQDGCYRTSNQIDRLMNYQESILYSMQYFHGSIGSARRYLRAMALIWNFHPVCQRIAFPPKYDGRYSSFEKINNFCYSYNWLENLLIAGSMNGYRPTT